MDVIQWASPDVHPTPMHYIGIQLLLPDKGHMHTAHLMQRVFRGVLAGRSGRKAAAARIDDFAAQLLGDGRTPGLCITLDNLQLGYSAERSSPSITRSTHALSLA